MKNSSYWKKRFSLLEASQNAYGQKVFHQIEPSFDKAQAQIQSQIEVWYARFADNNGITMQEARKLLSASELKEFKWSVQDYIKYGQENAINQQWMKELENASAKFHISRLEALKLHTQQSLEVAFGNELDSVDSMVKNLYQSGYYHTCFEIQKGFGIGWEIGSIDERKLERLLSKPWTTDGKVFSDRIWTSKQQMIGDLHQQLVRNIIQGKAPDEAIKSMTKYLQDTTKNAKYKAGRLVMTEQAFISAAAQKDAFNDLDVEEFEIVATLDSHTSEICQEMDGKHFPMKEYEPGTTAPPFHPWCRSTTVPYFDDEWGRSGERAARGEDGKTYYVPADMTYKDWSQAMVQGNTSGLQQVNPDGTIKDKPARNYDSDLSKKFGKDHYDSMRDLVDGCENESLQQVWIQSEDKIQVADAAYKGHEHCSGTSIYVNGARDAQGSSWEAPFQVSFHESGHAIDKMYKDKGTGVGFHYSSKYKDGIFPRTIKDEVQKMVDAKAVTIKDAFKVHKGDWDWLHDAGYISDTNFDWFKRYGSWLGGEPKYSKAMAYKAVEKEIKALAPRAKADLSDILEGATGGKISVGFGHGSSYWSKRKFGGVDDGLATEAFAEMIDSSMACPESLEAIKQYLPESYNIFLEMIENLL